jgi:nitric oxide reductase NorQ protein
VVVTAEVCVVMKLDPLATYRIDSEPYYRAVHDEVLLFSAAYAARLPLMLKGPTGCGKTRFIEHMAYQLGVPLITVACHEDMTASDLLGRFLLDAEGTRWQDGPLTLAARHGAICYLDELVEARQDTTVVVHPLTDSRRCLPLDKKSELVRAHPDFLLVVSYNPDYQSAAKELKTSTRQRFGALELGYPAPLLEAEVIVHEALADAELARRLVRFGQRTRALKGHGLEEGASTRMLIHAARLVVRGIAVEAACTMAVITPITDDLSAREALTALLAAEL